MADGRHPYGVRRTALATVNDDLPPSAKQAVWSPISATLTSSERDAVVVDLLPCPPATHATSSAGAPPPERT